MILMLDIYTHMYSYIHSYVFIRCVPHLTFLAAQGNRPLPSHHAYHILLRPHFPNCPTVASNCLIHLPHPFTFPLFFFFLSPTFALFSVLFSGVCPLLCLCESPLRISTLSRFVLLFCFGLLVGGRGVRAEELGV